MQYTLPAFAEGVAINATYSSAGENNEGSTAFGLTFTGVEGLSVSLGQGNNNGTVGVDIEQTVMSASYAIGSFTVGFTESEQEQSGATTSDDEFSAMG